MPDVSIVIPFRGSDPHRTANLSRVLDHLAPLDLPLILATDGREDGQPFNRSKALNYGMSLSPSEVFILHEADMLIPYDQLEDATREARKNLGLVVPFDSYKYLPQEGSRLVLSGVAEASDIAPEWTMDGGRSMGAVNVVSAQTMEAVGQYDETLESHGYDDNAMFEAFKTACGHATFIEGPGYHLWHEMAFAPWERDTVAADPENFSPAEVAATYRNRERVRMYQRATTPDQVRVLTAGGWLP